ncbi:MAG: hypothetical protein LBC80_02330 [Treponema sp.]|jgi:hypothetical protein|nr:hypothetical protein [Treponema sp.]
MRAFIPVKYSLFMFLGSLVFSTGVIFFLNFLLSGPKLGPHYDLLLKIRKPSAVSNELLIINTDEIVSGNDLFTVFMTLTEMDAANLVMTGKVSPAASPITLTEAEIRRRFMDEYSLIGANIRNLFEGIRLGFITPAAAPSFVEQVVELTELGRDRLVSALIDRDEDIIRSAIVFGNYLEVTTEPIFDWDNKIRRVMFFEYEHPGFLNLKNRFAASQLEFNDHDRFLWLRFHDGNEFDIRLDNKGNVITPWNSAFRHLDISIFRDYEESELALMIALTAANELGVFKDTLPELSPLYLGEYTFVLKEELLKLPNIENRITWRTARSDYFSSLQNFFNSSPVMQNNELLEAFAIMQEEYSRFSAIREVLEKELMLSYCIMGPENNALYSTLVANVLITGNHVIPARFRGIILWSVFLTFIVLIVVFLMRPFLLLICGLFLSFLSAVVFVFVFFIGSYWIDPLIVFSSSLCGVLLIFYCKKALLKHRIRTFRAAYGAVVSKSYLTNLIVCGRPRLSEINVTFAAIIAIRDTKLIINEARESTKDAGKARNAFLVLIKKVLFNAGAVIVSLEGDTILACFGSPLEIQSNNSSYSWSSHAKSYNPVDKAYALVRGLLEISTGEDPSSTWYFSIDAGECTFYWSPETGYSVKGKPAVRARILITKASRLKVRALMTDTVRKKLNIEGEALGTLYNKNDTYYALT